MKLWLDDERLAPDESWLWVKTAQEAINYLRWVQEQRSYGPMCSELTHMSFDHDLADVHYDYWHAGQVLPKDHPARVHARGVAAKEMTGYDVLLWMAEHEVWPTEACYVHSHNAVGAERMVGVINRYGPYRAKCRWTPYQA
jgi:hypothetical protein